LKNFSFKSQKEDRIDKILQEHLSEHNVSRTVIKKHIIEGFLKINDLVVSRPNFIIKKDHKVDFILKENENKDFLEKQNIEINIVFEDEYLIVIDKPNNMVVHPGAGNKKDTLANALAFYLEKQNKNNFGLVHRIDKQTTGLLLIAKDEKTLKIMQNQMKNREIKRTYLAICHGIIKERTGTINAPIGRDRNNRLRMSVTDINSKNAITHFEVIKRSKRYSLVQLKLETGRTHQIRVHMEYIKHPIVLDNMYGKTKNIANDKGQLLHAEKIEFIHPYNKSNMKFFSTLPKKFEEFLNNDFYI
jgi:23S rRNA pseudouridine1911/1915/1917 synthase